MPRWLLASRASIVRWSVFLAAPGQRQSKPKGVSRVKRRLISLLAPLALVLSVAVAAAEPQTFRIDTAHSTAGFSIRHFFSRVSGRFKDFTGTIQYDDKNLANSSVEVTIQTASIDTGNERRDTD